MAFTPFDLTGKVAVVTGGNVDSEVLASVMRPPSPLSRQAA